MTEILNLAASDVAPSRAAVLEHQGIPLNRTVSAATETLCDDAFNLFTRLAQPVGMLKSIGGDAFAPVYRGEGRNEPRTPVGDIFKQADRLALFAVTLGPQISREIAHRFESNDPALGCMLDSVASAAADRLAGVVEQHRLDRLVGSSEGGQDARALRYSPGYCGWHVSGQRALFGFLHPETVGISLRDSFLMDPLKSVSGVVVVGHRRIHDFDMTYPFCAQCETQGCRARISALDAEQDHKDPTEI